MSRKLKNSIRLSGNSVLIVLFGGLVSLVYQKVNIDKIPKELEKLKKAAYKRKIKGSFKRCENVLWY